MKYIVKAATKMGSQNSGFKVCDQKYLWQRWFFSKVIG